MARSANVKRSTQARLKAKDTPDEQIAETLVEMLKVTVSEADGTVKWDTLRVTVEESSADPSFYQLRTGIHVA